LNGEPEITFCNRTNVSATLCGYTSFHRHPAPKLLWGCIYAYKVTKFSKNSKQIYTYSFRHTQIRRAVLAKSFLNLRNRASGYCREVVYANSPIDSGPRFPSRHDARRSQFWDQINLVHVLVTNKGLSRNNAQIILFGPSIHEDSVVNEIDNVK
jgi:hypothetical protein